MLSLMSNLLFPGKKITYMIQVLSLSWFDWWRRFEESDQKDVTKVPSGKVELWLCNEVQESAKTVITQCIDDLWKATLRKIKKNKTKKSLAKIGKEQRLLRLKRRLIRWLQGWSDKQEWKIAMVC